MPKLWSDTIDAHRRAVRDTVLDTAAALVAERGLRAVTMSQVAERSGIGRATLYKYFPGVEAILLAWHERQVTRHLDYLAEVAHRHGEPGRRLEAVLEEYAGIVHEARARHDELSALVHRDEHVARGRHRLHATIRELVEEAAAAGYVRDDVSPHELAAYALHALGAARGLPSQAAVRRLVAVTLAGMRSPGRAAG